MGQIKKPILERNQEIKETYKKAIQGKETESAVMDRLAAQYGIGHFYVRSILKDQGIEIERKTEYDRSNKSKRDDEIVKMFNDENNSADIAKKYKITMTRVSQILRAKLGKSFKKTSEAPKLKIHLDAIKKELVDGIPYSCSCKPKTKCSCLTIIGIHGKLIIKQINHNLKYNVFQKALEYKIKDMVKMSKEGIPPKEIAAKHDVTLNYAYMILHDNGIRSKISKEAKLKRDKKIWDSKKRGTNIETIAKEHHITSTMVRIIISEKTKTLKADGKPSKEKEKEKEE
jgi:Mor family transcriptional regulator